MHYLLFTCGTYWQKIPKNWPVIWRQISNFDAMSNALTLIQQRKYESVQIILSSNETKVIYNKCQYCSIYSCTKTKAYWQFTYLRSFKLLFFQRHRHSCGRDVGGFQNISRIWRIVFSLERGRCKIVGNLSDITVIGSRENRTHDLCVLLTATFS